MIRYLSSSSSSTTYLQRLQRRGTRSTWAAASTRYWCKLPESSHTFTVFWRNTRNTPLTSLCLFVILLHDHELCIKCQTSELQFDTTCVFSIMSLPPSYRHRLLHAFGPPIRSVGPIRSSMPGPARRPSPYPSPPAANTHSHPSDDEFAASCFNDVYVSESDDEQDQPPQTPSKSASSRKEQTSSKRVRFQPSKGTPSHTSGNSSSQDEGMESTDEENDDKIPRPKGEVGQPSRGGYNLRIALGWEDARYERVKVSIMISHIFSFFSHLI